MLSMNISLIGSCLRGLWLMSRSHFFKCLNATIPLTCTLANEYPFSDEISKKNGTVRGDCIACDALFIFSFMC